MQDEFSYGFIKNAKRSRNSASVIPANSPSGIIDSFEKMLAGGKDSALLRFSLGSEYLKAGGAAMGPFMAGRPEIEYLDAVE